MSVTMTQIAQEAGVSVSLVSRLLRQDQSLKVAEETRQRVLDVAARLGGTDAVRAVQRYQQKRCAHIMVPVNREAISMATQYLANSPMIRAFEERLIESVDGRTSLVFFDHERRVEFMRELIETPDYCDGVLLLSSVTNDAMEELFVSRRFPVVGYDPQDESRGISTVCVNEHVGVRLAVQHLADLGHGEILYVGQRRARYSLFIASLYECGLRFNDEQVVDIPMPMRLVDPEDWYRESRRIFMGWLESHRPPTAIYCHNDHIALGIVDALEEHGYEPGRDVSVVGYDNLEVRGGRNPQSPRLTTIDNPTDTLGGILAETLAAQIQDRDRRATHERINPSLIVRGTTGPCRTTRGAPR